jgi:hypothetical protein
MEKKNKNALYLILHNSRGEKKSISLLILKFEIERVNRENKLKCDDAYYIICFTNKTKKSYNQMILSFCLAWCI